MLKLINSIIGENSLLEVDKDMYEEKKQIIQCPHCNTSNRINSTTDNNFFVTYQLESILKEVILQNIDDFIEKQHIVNENEGISDIYDGKLYKETQANNKITQL